MTPRVLYVITDSGTGGTEKILGELLKKIDPAKFDVAGVVVLKKKREMARQWEKAGVTVYEIGMGWIPTPAAIGRFVALVKKIKPDLVHAFLYHAVQLSRLAQKFGATFKLVSSPRVNYRFAGAFPLLIDRLLKSPEEMVQAESSATAEFLVKRQGYNADKIRRIFNGVHVKRSNSFGRREQTRKTWGIRENELLVGAAGRLHDQKGFDVLIESLKSLGKQAPKVVIAGEGPAQRTLQRHVRDLGVPVMLLGKMSEMEYFYEAIDVFVLSSRYEGMPNALLEAMSMGLPCVSTAVDGVLDIGRDGENMILVKPSDAIDLARGLEKMVSDGPRRAALGKAAISTIAKFSSEQMIRQYESLYAEVLLGRN